MLSELKQAEISPSAAAITTAPTAPEPKADAAPAAGNESQQHDGDQHDGDGKQTLVPHGALHEERQSRKALQAEVRALREQQAQGLAIQQQRDQEWAVGQQRLQQIQAHLMQRATPPPPDEAADPLGASMHLAKQTAAQVQAMRQDQFNQQQRQAVEQQQWAIQEHQRQQGVMAANVVVQSETAFSKEHPDYNDAVKFAVTRRVTELTAAGFDPHHAAQVAANDTRNLVQQWLQSGQNPAERAYAMAQSMGYTPKTVDPDERMAMQEAGQRAAKPSGGGTVRGKVTASQIANMSLTQLAKLSNEEFQAAMGG